MRVVEHCPRAATQPVDEGKVSGRFCCMYTHGPACMQTASLAGASSRLTLTLASVGVFDATDGGIYLRIAEGQDGQSHHDARGSPAPQTHCRRRHSQLESCRLSAKAEALSGLNCGTNASPKQQARNLHRKRRRCILSCVSAPVAITYTSACADAVRASWRCARSKI